MTKADCCASTMLILLCCANVRRVRQVRNQVKGALSVAILMAAAVVLVRMLSLALPMLRVGRDLKDLRVQAERLASQAILVRQEVQALRARLEVLVKEIVGPIPPATQGQEAIRG